MRERLRTPHVKVEIKHNLCYKHISMFRKSGGDMRILPHICFALIASLAPRVMAQESALEVCQSLNNLGLTDTYSLSERRAIAETEFDLFCKKSGSYSERFAKKSSSFTASYSSIGEKFGLGSSNNGAKSFSEAEFEQICRVGLFDFVSEYEQSVSTRVGSTLAAIVSDCVGNVMGAGADVVYGTVSLSSDGRSLFALVERSAPVEAENLVFAGVSPSSSFSKCESGNSKAEGLVLRNKVALTCTISADSAGNFPDRVQGFLVFQDEEGDARQENVKFDVLRPEYVRLEDVSSIVGDSIRRRIQENFKGSVTAFLNECPTGWSEFRTGFGRVLVGTGSGEGLTPRALLDRDGSEVFKLSQSNLPRHEHQVGTGQRAGPNDKFFSPAGNSETVRLVEKPGDVAAVDKMPPFVAVNFCVKN